MNFGKKLRKIRKSLGLSQKDLADIMEVSQRTVSHYENEDSQPDVITVCRLAYAFNTSIEHLLGYDGSKDEEGYKELRERTIKFIEKRRRYEEELKQKLKGDSDFD